MKLICAACGEEQEIQPIIGKDNCKYVDIQGKFLFKARHLRYVLCKRCAKFLDLID